MNERTYFDGECLRDVGSKYPTRVKLRDYSSVTLTVETVLNNLRPDGPFGSLILRCYKRWLANRQPSRFCDPKTAELWREYQFKRVLNHLDYLSKIMLDKETCY